MADLFTRHVLKNITLAEVQDVLKRARPLTKDKRGVLHDISNVQNSPDGIFNSAFMWGARPGRPARGLKEIARITTRHTFGAPAFFKPSLAEVVAQIPDLYRNRVAAFYVTTPDARGSDWMTELNADGTFGRKKNPVSLPDRVETLHQTTTILYEKSRSIKAVRYDPPEDSAEIIKYKADKAEQRLQQDGVIEQYMLGTFALVEGDSHTAYFEIQKFGYDVLQIMQGSSPQVGVLAGMPVQINIFWHRIIGLGLDGRRTARLIGFWEPTSLVVDYRLIEKWMKKKFPHVRHTGSDFFNTVVARLREDNCLPVRPGIESVICRHCHAYHCKQ